MRGRFLENVCQEILELDTGLLYRYPGSYEKFLEAKADRIRVEGLEQANAQNKVKHKQMYQRYYSAKYVSSVFQCASLY
jgi:ABC transport system ATP-binding/permease protein